MPARLAFFIKGIIKMKSNKLHYLSNIIQAIKFYFTKRIKTEDNRYSSWHLHFYSNMLDEIQTINSHFIRKQIKN